MKLTSIVILFHLRLVWTAVTPQNEASRPIFNRILEPVLGEVGTIKFVEEQVNAIGGSINQGIDLIHDTDHGTRICNVDDPMNQGVCFAPGKCGALGGHHFGTCSIVTPKNTCCKFERTCGEVGLETVTYFQNNAQNLDSDPCLFTMSSRLGSCQMRIDFIDFMFKPQDHETGICDVNNSLEVFFDSDSEQQGESLFFCGINSGNHFYLPISREDQKVHFRVRNRDRLVKDWNIRITQVDCRSGLETMKQIRAPEGCFQYFYQNQGPMASFNFDSKVPISPGQDYSICFQSNSSYCALAFQSFVFQMPSSKSCSNGEFLSKQNEVCCSDPDSYFAINDPQTPNRISLKREKFCGKKFGDADNIVVTFQKPFVARVIVDHNKLPSKADTGFLMAYQLIDSCG